MKALVYRGAKDVRVGNVPDAKIEQETDCLVKITSTNICGSDLHMYEGRTSVEEGKVLGHENLGVVVVEVGSAVRRVKAGDIVCLPFNIASGYCKNCERGYTGFCLTMNPGNAGAAYGYAEMGPYQGGQAEFLRVPYADFTDSGIAVQLAARLPLDGMAAYKIAIGRGLEGVIGKDSSSPYVEGRSRAWLKVKVKQQEEFVIGGFTAPEGSRQHFGALLVGFIVTVCSTWAKWEPDLATKFCAPFSAR
jgi:NADPH:quinone reductase-like Zn-dependent oxidoreductase